MENFEFLVFDGLDLKNYEKHQTNIDKLIEDIEKTIGGKSGCTTDTSSWMNRFSVLEDGNKRYTIIPSTIPSYNDVVKATVGKYAILLLEDGSFRSLTDDDIKYFVENLPSQFDENERKRKKEEKILQYSKVLIRDTFRAPLSICNDRTVDVLCYLIKNNMTDVFIPLATAAALNDEETVKNWCSTIVHDPGLEDIAISVPELATDVLVFFSPVLQFLPLGIGFKEGLTIYYSLCSDETWLKESFLEIATKESRDSYRKFISQKASEE